MINEDILNVEIEGVKFPDYKNMTIDNWDRHINLALINAVEIISRAKNSPRASLENTFMALERARSEIIDKVGPFHLLVDGGDGEAGKLYERMSGEIKKTEARFLSDPLFAKKCQQAFDENSHSWPGYMVRSAEKWLGEMKNMGALLGKDSDRYRLVDIAGEQAGLETQFHQKLSAACSDYLLFDGGDLRGVDRGRLDMKNGQYTVMMLSDQVDEIVRTCEIRDTRERVYKKYKQRGSDWGKDEFNTNELIEKISALRQEKARILGYDNFAQLNLVNTMAKNIDRVEGVILDTWSEINDTCERELDNLKQIAKEDGVEIKAWDVEFYRQKIKEVKKHTETTNPTKTTRPTLKEARDAAFLLANKLFGLEFEEIDLQGPWPGVKNWLVRRDSKAIGGMITDYRAREGKGSGAWMHLITQGHRMDGGALPVVANTCNFAGEDGELNESELQTLFHEFGHALHGLLSRTHLPSQSGTNTLGDWVELPSQLLEHWVKKPEICEKLGLDRNSGGGDSGDDLLFKNKYLQSAWLDIKIHQLGLGELGGESVVEFEERVLVNMGASELVEPNHRINHFSHLFSDEQYAAGYYGYLWSEILDREVFEKVAKNNPFSRQVGEMLEKHIYGIGDEIDPNVAFEGLMNESGAPEKKVVEKNNKRGPGL